jgi:hypothetical protein
MQAVCGYCSSCGNDRMQADAGTPFGIAWPQTCKPDICHSNPDCCGLALEDADDVAAGLALDDLTKRIVGGNGAELNQLLNSYNGALLLNVRRTALHLLNRNRYVIGHYPLTDGQFNDLMSYEPTWTVTE